MKKKSITLISALAVFGPTVWISFRATVQVFRATSPFSGSATVLRYPCGDRFASPSLSSSLFSWDSIKCSAKPPSGFTILVCALEELECEKYLEKSFTIIRLTIDTHCRTDFNKIEVGCLAQHWLLWSISVVDSAAWIAVFDKARLQTGAAPRRTKPRWISFVSLWEPPTHVAVKNLRSCRPTRYCRLRVDYAVDAWLAPSRTIHRLAHNSVEGKWSSSVSSRTGSE